MKYVVFAVLIIMCSWVSADGLSEVAKEQRKIVSRMYQATDASLELCPLEDKTEFKESLKRFQDTYPDLITLLEKSKFREYAIQKFSVDLEVSKHDSEENLSKRCRYMKSIIDSMVDTPDGHESVKHMKNVLSNQQ